jgi:phage tail protein X
MATYTTIQGDMWDSIAYSQMGSTAYTGRLMERNPAYREYYIFPAGCVLTLPEEEESYSDTLPPWKSGDTQ